MITEERLDELQKLFWTETDVPWTQEWRANLTNEEYYVVREWEIQISRGFRNLYSEILKFQNPRVQGEH